MNLHIQPIATGHHQLHLDFDRLMLRFLEDIDIKGNSKATYRRALKRFLNWMNDQNSNDLQKSDLLRYKDYLQHENLSPLTISNYIIAMKRFFEWLETSKLFPNISKEVRSLRRSNAFQKDNLSPAQIQKLLLSIKSLDIQGKRDFALINLLVRTGLRCIEVVRAKVDDIRYQHGHHLLYVQGKGREEKDDFVILTEESFNPVQSYLQLRKPLRGIDPLFSSLSDRNHGEGLTTRSVSRIVKGHLRAIGIDSHRVTAHSLRHTAITLALQGGASLQQAKMLGRHKSINTTLIYAHNLERIADAPEFIIDDLLKTKV